MSKYDGPAFFRKNGQSIERKSLGRQKTATKKLFQKDDTFQPAFRMQERDSQSEHRVHSAYSESISSSQAKLETNVNASSNSTSTELIEKNISLVDEPKAKITLEPKQSINSLASQASLTKKINKPRFTNFSESTAIIKKTAAASSETKLSNGIQKSDTTGYQFPPFDLLPVSQFDESMADDWVEQQAEALNDALMAFDVSGQVVNWTVGPTVTQFEIELGRGVKVSKITNLSDDLKLQLAAKDIRIEAPIPGKSTVGIEVPNLKPRPVLLSEVINSNEFQQSESPLTVALGVDLFGKPRVYDLRKMPHGLIAGATGSGKSVFINSILVSLLYKATPAEVKLLLIDPKAVELAPYNELPHLLAPVISDAKAASAALKWVTNEMDQRYDRLAAAGARNIEQYNKKAQAAEDFANQLPYIVVIVDELADLMMVASSEIQDYIVRITQKARAAGIHLLIATQRPSVDVVTGLIKNNIPTRAAFMVSSQIDSRTILDQSGAERLLGRGDMLFLGNGESRPIRIQGTFIDEEIDPITDFVRSQAAPNYSFDPTELKQQAIQSDDEDELMDDVLKFIAEEDTISTSKLQRMFSIGYNRAASMIDVLESQGFISEQHGSKPREVYYTKDDTEE